MVCAREVVFLHTHTRQRSKGKGKVKERVGVRWALKERHNTLRWRKHQRGDDAVVGEKIGNERERNGLLS